MNAKLLLSSVAALAASLVANPAHAWVHACNQTSNPIWIAYADEGRGSVFDYGDNGCNSSNSGAWHATGWYKVNPGACVTPNGGKAYDFAHVFYAEDSQGHVWNGSSADRVFICTPWTAYSRCTSYNVTPDSPCASGERLLRYPGWYEVSSTNWTLNFHL